jgi:hypothetical protein
MPTLGLPGQFHAEGEEGGPLGTPKDAAKQVQRGRGPKDIKRIDRPEQSVPGSQWHAHQEQEVKGRNPALNFDGSHHDGAPTFSKKTLEWLKGYGWKTEKQ